MFDRVDAALGAFLQDGLPDGVVVRFCRGLESADEDPVPAGGQALRVILHSIAEDLSSRAHGMQSIRDVSGTVTGRQAFPRRYALSYAVFAEAGTVAAEHALLGRASYLLSVHDVLPARHADEQLVAAGDLNLMLGPPLQPQHGGLPRFGLNIVVIAPMAAPLQTDLPKAPQTVQLAATPREPAASHG